MSFLPFLPKLCRSPINLEKDPETGAYLDRKHLWQFKKGHSNGRILVSATGKRGIKRRLESKTIEQKYNAIMEVEKGHRSHTHTHTHTHTRGCGCQSVYVQWCKNPYAWSI